MFLFGHLFPLAAAAERQGCLLALLVYSRRDRRVLGLLLLLRFTRPARFKLYSFSDIGFIWTVCLDDDDPARANDLRCEPVPRRGPVSPFQHVALS